MFCQLTLCGGLVSEFVCAAKPFFELQWARGGVSESAELSLIGGCSSDLICVDECKGGLVEGQLQERRVVRGNRSC